MVDSKAEGISVLIVSKGRVELLERLFQSLQKARENFVHPSEIILVDDSNKDDVKRIESLVVQYDVRLFCFGPSVAAKRNYAAKVALYRYMLYCDSDCYVSENILGEHYQKIISSDSSVGAVAAPLILVGRETGFMNIINQSPWTNCFKEPLTSEYVDWGATANFLVRKDVFDEIGGFDETFPNKPGGEDVDFGFRIIEAGYKIACNAKAVAYHGNETWLSPSSMISRLKNYGISEVKLVEKFPERTVFCLRTLPIWFLVLCITVVVAIAFKKPWSLFLAPLFFAIDTIGYSVIQRIVFKRKKIKPTIVIFLLSLVGEFFYLMKTLSRFRLLCLNKTVLYSRFQERGVVRDVYAREILLIAEFFLFALCFVFL